MIGSPAEPPLRLSPAGLWEVLAQKYSGIELVGRVMEELRCEWPELIRYINGINDSGKPRTSSTKSPGCCSARVLMILIYMCHR